MENLENLKKGIISDYSNAVINFVNGVLLRKGFIKTSRNEILKLNVFELSFDSINIEDMVNIIDANINNLWNIPSEMKNNLVNEILMELLPTVSTLEAKHYIEYLNLNPKVTQQKDLKKTVKKLLKDNHKNHKKIFPGGLNAPEYQSQVLVNNDVFYCKKDNSYYQFKDNLDKFEKLSAKDIWEMVKNEYPKANVTDIDIADYMKTSYLFFITNSDLPKVYNDYQDNLLLLDGYKRDFNKVSKIVSNFG